MTHRKVILISLGMMLLFAISRFYVWTSTHGYSISRYENLVKPYHRYYQMSRYYNLLTDAFLKGQTSLLDKPHEKILSMFNPYDPRSYRNREHINLRYHDASLYKGKYYLYWGVTPIFLLYMPYRLMGGKEFPHSLSVPLFFMGGIIASLLLFRCILKHLKIEPSFLILSLIILGISLGSTMPFVARRPLIYEIAISCGYFCTMTSIFFMISGCLSMPHSLWRLLLGSLFLGLAVASRPNMVLYFPILFFASFWLFKTEPDKNNMRVKLSVVWLPFIISIFLLGLYNYIRFDSWTEFGTSYQLTRFKDLRMGIKMSSSHILPCLYHYIFESYRFNDIFPYIHVNPPFSLHDSHMHNIEPLIGLLHIIPWTLILLLYPIVLRFSHKFCAEKILDESFLRSFIFTLILMTAIQMVTLSLSVAMSMRYIVDFAPILTLASFLVWIEISNMFRSIRWSYISIQTIMCLMVAYGVVINMAISFTGENDTFKGFNPYKYYAIKDRFDSILIEPFKSARTNRKR